MTRMDGIRSLRRGMIDKRGVEEGREKMENRRRKEEQGKAGGGTSGEWDVMQLPQAEITFRSIEFANERTKRSNCPAILQEFASPRDPSSFTEDISLGFPFSRVFVLVFILQESQKISYFPALFRSDNFVGNNLILQNHLTYA